MPSIIQNRCPADGVRAVCRLCATQSTWRGAEREDFQVDFR
jgi:hypothetical protein